MRDDEPTFDLSDLPPLSPDLEVLPPPPLRLLPVPAGRGAVASLALDAATVAAAAHTTNMEVLSAAKVPSLNGAAPSGGAWSLDGMGTMLDNLMAEQDAMLERWHPSDVHGIPFSGLQPSAIHTGWMGDAYERFSASRHVREAGGGVSSPPRPRAATAIGRPQLRQQQQWQQQHSAASNERWRAFAVDLSATSAAYDATSAASNGVAAAAGAAAAAVAGKLFEAEREGERAGERTGPISRERPDGGAAASPALSPRWRCAATSTSAFRAPPPPTPSAAAFEAAAPAPSSSWLLSAALPDFVAEASAAEAMAMGRLGADEAKPSARARAYEPVVLDRAGRLSSGFVHFELASSPSPSVPPSTQAPSMRLGEARPLTPSAARPSTMPQPPQAHDYCQEWPTPQARARALLGGYAAPSPGPLPPPAAAQKCAAAGGVATQSSKGSPGPLPPPRRSAAAQ